MSNNDASAYFNSPNTTALFQTSTPYWLNKGDNAWQLTAATLVGIQSLPGLVILYGSYVKKKWAVNSTFMALYAFAAVLVCWFLWAYKLAFGEYWLPFWGKPGVALTHDYLLTQSILPGTVIPAGRLSGVHFSYNASGPQTIFFPMVTTVYYQFAFAALTVILVAGSLLGRMNIHAWMIFVPLWLTFSYTVGAFSLWGGGFLYQKGVLDYCGGYVIHLSSGVAGFTAAFWVGPRLKRDRERFPPNNLLLMLGGAGLLWLGWSGFNGGGTYSANTIASLAVANTHLCAATSLLVWLALDYYVFKKPSVIGCVQGMITGLVCITPAAGFVEAWAAIIMGILAAIIPWYTMNVIHKNSGLLRRVDDTMAVLHTHAVAGMIGGICVGLFTHPELVALFSPIKGLRGFFYSWKGHSGNLQGLKQLGWQLAGGCFIIGWNVVVTSLICYFIELLRIPLRMSEDDLAIGDDAAHGEEAYALWGDGETEESMRNDGWYDYESGSAHGRDKSASGGVTPQSVNRSSVGQATTELPVQKTRPEV
ncbi:unnamed protein product [Calypogeia fissa]